MALSGLKEKPGICMTHPVYELAFWDHHIPAIIFDDVQRLPNSLEDMGQRVGASACAGHARVEAWASLKMVAILLPALCSASRDAMALTDRHL